MFDTDQFVSDCLDAAGESDARRAIKEVLARAVRSSEDVRRTLPDPPAGLNRLYVSPELTVLQIVWPPHMSLFPHDHRMWAAIGIYAGHEENQFFRRGPEGLVRSGAKQLGERDVMLLGDDAIHAVDNPLRSYTAAFHVYGGDFFAEPRSEWDPVTLEERPFDIEHANAAFAEAAASAADLESTGGE